MSNRIFKGITVEKVLPSDNSYSRIAGCWGLKDNKSGEWLKNCFSRTHDGAQAMSTYANGVLDTSVRKLAHLKWIQPYHWEDDYIPKMYFNSWISLNPDVLPEIDKIISEQAMKKINRSKYAHGARKRGRPKKNSIESNIGAPDAPKRKRGRPRKNPEVADNAEIISDKHIKTQPKNKYILKNPPDVIQEVKRKRGRPRKNPI